MSVPADAPETDPGSWAALLGREHRGVMTVLAGGVALYATNVFLTTSLLPSAIQDIGGQELYAWVTTLFLLGSVITSVLVSRTLAARGERGAYLLALASFAVGSVTCAAAPTMGVLLAGRAVQGLGGGLLAGLGYALIRSRLPSALWARGTALISAMWGVGTFAGPAAGGAFAQYAHWRLAFAALVIATAGLSVVVPRVLPARSSAPERQALPVRSIALVTSAAMAVCVAGLLDSALLAALGVLVGVGLLAAFYLLERRAAVTVLPAATFTGSRLPWIYLTLAALAVASTTEAFVPLFGQRLGGLAPLAAGFLGAAIAAGWTLGEIPSASADGTSATRWIVRLSPPVVAIGFGTMAVLQHQDASVARVLAWAGALAIAGAGIGIAWPHLASGAMSSVSDETEGAKASAAINIVQLVANAFGAALTGVFVNTGGPDTLSSARYLYTGIAALALLGTVAAALSQRAARGSGTAVGDRAGNDAVQVRRTGSP